MVTDADAQEELEYENNRIHTKDKDSIDVIEIRKHTCYPEIVH